MKINVMVPESAPTQDTPLQCCFLEKQHLHAVKNAMTFDFILYFIMSLIFDLFLSAARAGMFKRFLRFTRSAKTR